MIVGYDHPHFGQFPAVVSTEHGQGRITTVGTVPNPALAADLVRWLAPPGARPDVGRVAGVGDRLLGNQLGWRADPRSPQLELGAGPAQTSAMR